MKDRYNAEARKLGKYFDWDANSEQVNEIAQSLRESAAEAFERASTLLGCDCDEGKKSKAVPDHHFTCIKKIMEAQARATRAGVSLAARRQ